MRIANIDGRAHLVTDGLALDVAAVSGGRFGPGPQAVYDDWTASS
jgi:2,4-didehydro-3-deoxy-L-rhamnonate hydrolase